MNKQGQKWNRQPTRAELKAQRSDTAWAAKAGAADTAAKRLHVEYDRIRARVHRIPDPAEQERALHWLAGELRRLGDSL